MSIYQNLFHFTCNVIRDCDSTDSFYWYFLRQHFTSCWPLFLLTRHWIVCSFTFTFTFSLNFYFSYYFLFNLSTKASHCFTSLFPLPFTTFVFCLLFIKMNKKFQKHFSAAEYYITFEYIYIDTALCFEIYNSLPPLLLPWIFLHMLCGKQIKLRIIKVMVRQRSTRFTYLFYLYSMRFRERRWHDLESKIQRIVKKKTNIPKQKSQV